MDPELSHWTAECNFNQSRTRALASVRRPLRLCDDADAACRPGKPLLYLGRLGTQIKVLGHCVELGEVEAAVGELSGPAGVVALGWPKNETGADGIEVFIEADELDLNR